MNFLAGLAQLLFNNTRLWQSSDRDIVGPIFHPHEYETFGNLSTRINYQIDSPTTDYGEPIYEQHLLEHEFRATWGEPYRVSYQPPPSDIAFSHVKLFLEIDSFGIQYDRLAHIFIDGVEIWRPSTSEPRGSPSYFNFTKDVSSQIALFREPAELSFELNNLITDKLNGTFTVNLSALYYHVPPEEHLSPNEWYEHDSLPASAITKVFDLHVATGPLSTSLDAVPRNTTRAVLQVVASGNGNDEFWYAGESSNDGNGPIRHVAVKIDGHLAGIVSPFYQIYTGGFEPRLWSPFVAPNAYDVPSYHIDVTPFLPTLWEKQKASANGVSIEISVLNGQDQVVNHEWLISASLLTWQTEGVEGSGEQQLPVQVNDTSRVVLPGVEVTHFSQTINVTSELFLNGSDGPSTFVAWSQHRSISAVITDGTTISHASKGKSLTKYEERSYCHNYNFDLALALDQDSIAVAEGFHTHDYSVEPTSPEDILSRTHSIHYNGTWSSPNDQNSLNHGAIGAAGTDSPSSGSAPINVGSGVTHDRNNGSDVFVKYRDPHRVGDSTFHQHAVSRNGAVITFNKTNIAIPGSSSADEDNYMAPIMGMINRKGGIFPFKPPSKEDIETRRRIRQKWLKHTV